jgi:uncharacterized membrane protein YeaQ/YmgE (transglycosylase-associated protein family)
MDINILIQRVMALPYVPSVISWIFFGLVAGVTAKLILPGQENLGWLRTILVGIVGAFLGGIGAASLGYNVHVGWNLLGFMAAVAGSVVLLLINRLVTKS